MDSFTQTSNREWPFNASYHSTRVRVNLHGAPGGGPSAARGVDGQYPNFTHRLELTDLV
jgi:hypothetical protein